jgi:hypothetical protein
VKLITAVVVPTDWTDVIVGAGSNVVAFIVAVGTDAPLEFVAIKLNVYCVFGVRLAAVIEVAGNEAVPYVVPP